MKPLVLLWKFSRPHTIIGSVISISTLYLIIYRQQGIFDVPYFILALLIGVTCNMFIVGINQVADVDLDKINKPDLPIPAGELTISEAKWIVAVVLLLCLAMAWLVSPFLFLIIAAAAFIGWAYSMPPLHLKQHHLPAALAIATVRGVLLNAGGFMVFNYVINHSVEMPKNVVILTFFVIAFSVAIAWFKDLPDMAGDSKYNLKTFAILYSPKITLVLGHILVAAAYLFTIYIKYMEVAVAQSPSTETKILLYGHIILFVLFIINAFAVKINEHASLKRFYKRFWWFFFAEYLVYLVAYV